jgi:catechol 2,3-dioxygenase-like lactoylglutathione lyase family enzyme
MTREQLRFGHVSFEVASIATTGRFHDRFLGTLGFRRFQQGDWYLGYRRGESVVWFFRRGRRIQVHREIPRLPRTDEDIIPDHIGFCVASWKSIARWEDRLRAVALPPFYPVDRGPARDRSERYRSAAWVDPDRIVWEIYAVREPRRVRG